MLVSLDRTHKAGVVAYSQAVNTNSLENRSRNLKQTLANNWRGYLDADIVVKEEINLSERLAPSGIEVGQVDRRAGSLAGASVLRTLVYLSSLHPPLPSC